MFRANDTIDAAILTQADAGREALYGAATITSSVVMPSGSGFGKLQTFNLLAHLETIRDGHWRKPRKKRTI